MGGQGQSGYRMQGILTTGMECRHRTHITEVGVGPEVQSPGHGDGCHVLERSEEGIERRCWCPEQLLWSATSRGRRVTETTGLVGKGRKSNFTRNCRRVIACAVLHKREACEAGQAGCRNPTGGCLTIQGVPPQNCREVLRLTVHSRQRPEGDRQKGCSQQAQL